MNAFPEVADWTDEETLHRVRRVRQIFDTLNRRIVQESCRRFLGEPHEGDRLLEFGAGDGQLRNWLPNEFQERTLHTEPSDLFAERFVQRNPAAQFQKASIYDLPFADGSQAGVVALCVMDALREPDRARDEIARVLRPQGCFLHFLDLAPACLDTFLAEQLAQELVPLPSFDDGQTLTPSIVEDFVVCPRTNFVAVISYLNATRHPAGLVLAEYLQHIEQPSQRSQYFMAVTRDPMVRQTLIMHLLDASRLTAGYPGLELNWTPRASLNFLQQRLTNLFSESAGFRLHCCDVLSAREWHAPWPELPTGCRHFARIVGQVAARRVAEPFAVGECRFPEGRPADDTEVLLESGIFVFAASKAADH